MCNVGSELFRRDSEVEQKHSSLRDDLTKAKQLLCSIADKVTSFNIFKLIENPLHAIENLNFHH